MTDLLSLLKTQFDPRKAADLDITVAFDCGDQSYRVGIHDGHAEFHDGVPASSPTSAELVLYFRDEQLAADILTAQASPLDAFMNGDFRSNGYIIWTFQTLAAFSKSA